MVTLEQGKSSTSHRFKQSRLSAMSARQGSAADEWACLACSFRNSSFISYCEICETARATGSQVLVERGGSFRAPVPDTLPERPAESGTEAEESVWPCSLCSFKNAKALPYCEMCEAPQRKSHIKGMGIMSSSTAHGKSAGDVHEKRIGVACGSVRFKDPARPDTSTKVPPQPSSEADVAYCGACPVCSFINVASRMACEVCEAPLGIQNVEQRCPRTGPGIETLPPASNPRSNAQVEEEAPGENGALSAPCSATAVDDEERRLLVSMGWDPNDCEGEGGLEEWEIDAANEGFIEHLQHEPQEGLRERAHREFEAWKGKSPATGALRGTQASSSSQADQSG